MRFRVSDLYFTDDFIHIHLSGKSQRDVRSLPWPDEWELDRHSNVLKNTKPMEQYAITVGNHKRRGKALAMFTFSTGHTWYKTEGDMVCEIISQDKPDEYFILCKFPPLRTEEECWNMSVPQLRDICKEREVSGMSRATKDGLVRSCCVDSQRFPPGL
jgi:hypothetical protein